MTTDKTVSTALSVEEIVERMAWKLCAMENEVWDETDDSFKDRYRREAAQMLASKRVDQVAAALLSASRTQEPAEVATSGSAAEYTRDQIARMAFAIYYSSNLCAPQNIAAVIEEIDTCGNDCEHVSGSTCSREQAGKFCPFSVAEDLRQLSAALYGEKEPRGYVESVFGPDRMPALRAAYITPPAPELCQDEGCDHYGTDHVCVTRAPAPERSKEEVGATTFDDAAKAAWDFVRPTLLDRGREKGYAGVWSDGFRQGWDAATRSALEPASLHKGEDVARACLTCNSPRSVDPCPKCGTALTKPADGWDWPGLPDIGRIRELAREVGYAIGVHGSLERDLDLIAAPWVADAVGPMELAEHIAYGLGGNVVDFERQDKPCGRWACNIHTPDWTKMIDLSVMPPAPLPVGVTDAARDAFYSRAEVTREGSIRNFDEALMAAFAALSKPGEQG